MEQVIEMLERKFLENQEAINLKSSGIVDYYKALPDKNHKDLMENALWDIEAYAKESIQLIRALTKLKEENNV